MKVYIATMNPFPIGLAATNRIIHYGKGLVKSGMECEVVVIYRTERGNIVNSLANGVYEDIPFRYISGNTERSNSFIRRRIDDLISDIGLFCNLCKNIKKITKVYRQGQKVYFFLP